MPNGVCMYLFIHIYPDKFCSHMWNEVGRDATVHAGVAGAGGGGRSSSRKAAVAAGRGSQAAGARREGGCCPHRCGQLCTANAPVTPCIHFRLSRLVCFPMVKAGLISFKLTTDARHGLQQIILLREQYHWSEWRATVKWRSGAEACMMPAKRAAAAWLNTRAL